ncbi:phosphodiester glycosidase family protein [Candidatus Synechococcus calcipolaris G9]|uniref:Phosphodiester glycosidase family protein n=1 Tax=Candidatus Synechococcus calcipolaris G9 TaxID=1497997 RepID=A0ABT6EYV6_9SYNE|nr:phosphodiester glycosidase family protein [Candidatus Synechococcus calcipolaris]MDG2990215.1 phosphodiester glycosidase family protein [Candidatus Synechococcus calcipolaris G9]
MIFFRPWVSSILTVGLVLFQGMAGVAQTRQGNQINLNGRDYGIAWSQWTNNQGQTVTGISDGGLATRFGVLLQDTNDPNQQPVLWFKDQPLTLATRFSSNGMYRYLDVSDLIQSQQWQVNHQGQTLRITPPPARILGWRQGRQPWGDRWVFDLDRATPWHISRLTFSRTSTTPRQFGLTIEASGSLTALPNTKISTATNRTVIERDIPGTTRPDVTMLADPPRLVVDFRNDAPANRSITWAPGLRWQEQTVTLGPRQFPVSVLAVNPQQPGLSLRPIWFSPTTLVGISSLADMAQRWQSAAVINAGFFNRDRQMPLGAIRDQGNWISGPILNRGAIAWNDQGQTRVGRLFLQQTVSTPTGSYPIVTFNSGYLQAGLALYTPAWGPSYSPQTGNETVITVRNNRVMGQQAVSSQRPQTLAIPQDGLLLVARSYNSVLGAFANGATVQIQTTANPPEFNAFPYIAGAGPLLIDRGQVVLNAAAEQFGGGLATQAAPRSAIGQLGNGTILLVTTHNRVGGPGPTLAEWTQILRQMGLVNALNLDGGSSTAMYMGGQLLDRHSVTTTRVSNGIGIFWQPR